MENYGPRGILERHVGMWGGMLCVCVCGGGVPHERKGEGERWGVAVSGA